MKPVCNSLAHMINKAGVKPKTLAFKFIYMYNSLRRNMLVI